MTAKEAYETASKWKPDPDLLQIELLQLKQLIKERAQHGAFVAYVGDFSEAAKKSLEVQGFQYEREIDAISWAQGQKQ